MSVNDYYPRQALLMGDFMIHISVLYIQKKNQRRNEWNMSREKQIWQLITVLGGRVGKIALVDTQPSNVEEWKIVEEWTFPETK